MNYLCHSCTAWVDCSEKDKLHGFCLCKELYTYTLEKHCNDYVKNPLIEENFEEPKDGRLF